MQKALAILIPLTLIPFLSLVQGETRMEKLNYFNQPNCYRLSNGTVEVIVTTDIGPRVIRYSFIGEENILAELPDPKVTTEFGDWKPWGGHRLWAAPESMPRTYWPDNTPVEFKLEGTNTIHLIQPVEGKTGIQKEMVVTLAVEGTEVTIHHKITNRNLWAIELAPWALTIMHGGGTAILPQEPYRSHDDYLLPARPMVLWHYTNLSDPRWMLGQKFLRLKTDASMPEAQKIGIANKQGWAGYSLGRRFFLKRFAYKDGASYPDDGSSTEVYTSGSFMEIETLAPVQHLQPGQAAEHLERWYLFNNVDIGSTELSLKEAVEPLLASTGKPSTSGR